MTDYMNQYERNLKAMNNSGKGTPQPGEIWWVSNLNGIKDRPVLILGHTGSTYTFFMGGSTAGKNVNERSAMQMTAVYACVRILSEANKPQNSVTSGTVVDRSYLKLTIYLWKFIFFQTINSRFFI